MSTERDTYMGDDQDYAHKQSLRASSHSVSSVELEYAEFRAAAATESRLAEARIAKLENALREVAKHHAYASDLGKFIREALKQ